MKKVLLLRSSIGVFGAERVVLELAQGLSKKQYKAVVGVIGNKHSASRVLKNEAERLGLDTQYFPARYPFDIKTISEIRKFVLQNSVDILHAHGYKANFYALTTARFTGTACMATLHPWTETSYSLKSRIYTFLDKTWLRLMDSIVAVSKDVKQQFNHAVPNKKCLVISNGIAVERFSEISTNGNLLAELDLGIDDIKVGAIGRLVPEKGYIFLFTSIKTLIQKYPNLRLIIAGDGPIRQELEEKIKNLKLENNVFLLGVRDNVAELLNIMDIFVLPSISEGLPIVLLEAMAAGKPILATEVGDIPQVIRSGYSGLLVPPADDKALCYSLEYLIKNRKEAEKLSAAAYKEVQQRFSSDTMVEQYIAEYEKIFSFKSARN